LSEPLLAAYGVAFAGLGGSGVPAPAGWPRWTVAQEVGPADDSPGLDVWEDRARIGMPGVGEYRLSRDERTIRVRVREPWSPEMLIHPGLAPAAAVIAHWMGRAALHAAAVLIDGRIWGLLGDKGAGKSTTTAYLAGHGCGLVTDDLLVVDGTTGFAGPGEVDLRGDVGPRFGGEPLGVVGERERWRLALSSPRASAPLAGWLDLRWVNGEASCRELAPVERLAMLDACTMLPPDGVQLLQLGDLPMLRLSRPSAVEHASRHAELALQAVRAVSP
jgi:hypothetical protein